MKITRLKPISVITPLILIILAGCYPKTDEIQELYERQASLEAKIDKLTQEMETGLSGISQDIGKVEASQQKLAQDVQILEMKNAVPRERATSGRR